MIDQNLFPFIIHRRPFVYGSKGARPGNSAAGHFGIVLGRSYNLAGKLRSCLQGFFRIFGVFDGGALFLFLLQSHLPHLLPGFLLFFSPRKSGAEAEPFGGVIRFRYVGRRDGNLGKPPGNSRQVVTNFIIPQVPHVRNHILDVLGGNSKYFQNRWNGVNPQPDLRHHTASPEPSLEKPVELRKGEKTVPGIFLYGTGTHTHQFTRGQHHLHAGYLFTV